jgi:hypothetical protein
MNHNIFIAPCNGIGKQHDAFVDTVKQGKKRNVPKVEALVSSLLDFFIVLAVLSSTWYVVPTLSFFVVRTPATASLTDTKLHRRWV